MNIAESYLILGVGENATFEEIRSAYRTLIKEEHPDTHHNKDSERLRIIIEAYQKIVEHHNQQAENIDINNDESDYSRAQEAYENASKNQGIQEYEYDEDIDASNEANKKRFAHNLQDKENKKKPRSGLSNKLFHYLLDDRQRIYLTREMCSPNKTIRFIIRYGFINSARKIIEFNLPEEIESGHIIKLNGAGKKIGDYIGNLYLEVIFNEVG